MGDWKTRLQKRKLLISDGACGTELTRRGLPAGQAPELWNLDRPDEVRAVAAGYVAAGSDIILTNSFGGNRLKLAKSGLDDRTEEINRAAARISREAAGDKALVFACVGPTGEFMAPLGAVSKDEMIAVFAEQAGALADGGVDGIVMETFIDLNEVLAALRAVKENTDLPTVMSMTFEKGARGYATVMGITPEQTALQAEAAGAELVGANCGAGIEQMIDIMRAMRDATRLPLWAKPNAGLPELVGGKTVFRQTPEDMVKHLGELVRAGANIIGGCCGATPDHIRRLVEERA